MAVLPGMTIHDSNLAARGTVLDRVIGMFSHSSSRACDQERQLAEIGDFLLGYRLEVTSFTLSAAYDCVTGMDMRLARKVKEREDSGMPVTLQWLEQQRLEDSRHSSASMIQTVIEKLEHNVEGLACAASTARAATKEYNTVLSSNEKKIANSPDASVGEILGLVREMVGHARTLEGQMRRTEERSREMRCDLEKARRSADEDHLTGLPNRRSFESHLHKAIERKAEDEPLSIGFCDIDHFKQVNDRHGHDVGDRVLKLVAEHLVDATGNACFVARHGGEEFALLFEKCSLNDAQQVLDEAREKLTLRRITNRQTGEIIGPVTFSAGLARYYDGHDPSLALRAADQALYEAKRGGRNRIALSE